MLTDFVFFGLAHDLIVGLWQLSDRTVITTTREMMRYFRRANAVSHRLRRSNNVATAFCFCFGFVFIRRLHLNRRVVDNSSVKLIESDVRVIR